MELSAIAPLRLVSQQLARPRFDSAKALVAWMGAIQAQDFGMSHWAIGLRLPGATVRQVAAAIDRGQVIRTHLMRPTWHYVSADDIYWLLALSAAQVRQAMKSNDRAQGLSAADFLTTNRLIEAALARRRPPDPRRAGQRPQKRRHRHRRQPPLAHLHPRRAGWRHLQRRHPGRENHLCPARAARAETAALTEDEALARLAQRYFTSHAPATLQDFSWWSGLTAGRAARAIELVNPRSSPKPSPSAPTGCPTTWRSRLLAPRLVHLLPAYDEFLIAYTDRSAALPVQSYNKTISSNGVFRPVIVLNGGVVGLWKRTIKKERLVVETELYEPADQTTRSLIETAAMQFGQFLEKETQVTHKI